MASRSEDPKLIIRVINFELVQPICSAYRNVTQTDRRTDGRTTYDSNTALALRASRRKKYAFVCFVSFFLINLRRRAKRGACMIYIAA